MPRRTRPEGRSDRTTSASPGRRTSTPTNWQDLDNSDTDLGGASEILVNMPGAQYPDLVVAGGKDGNLYILNRDNLGGIGGELFRTQVSRQRQQLPAGQGGNMVVMKITQSPVAATTVWCSTQGDLASPMVTTTDGTSNAKGRMAVGVNGQLYVFTP